MAFDFGAAGGGAAAGLEDVLKRMFLEQVQRQRASQEQAELGERARATDLQNSLGRSRLNLEGEELGFRRQQHADEAPLRTGRLKLMGAQTEDLERQPIEAADARAHQGMMQERGHLNELEQMTKQGDLNRQLARIRMADSGSDAGQYTSIQQGIGPDGKPAILIVDRRTGTATPAQMPTGYNPNRPARPVTGSERQTLNYFNRMLQAERDARAVEDKIGQGDLMASEAAPGWLENFLKSSEGQRYTQAQKAYTEARLRKESGAAIPPGEFENDRTMNFRRLNDKPETLKQKRNQRLTTLRGLGGAAGRALEEHYGEGKTLDDILAEFAEQQATTSGAGGGQSALDILNARRGNRP